MTQEDLNRCVVQKIVELAERETSPDALDNYANQLDALDACATAKVFRDIADRRRKANRKILDARENEP